MTEGMDLALLLFLEHEQPMAKPIANMTMTLVVNSQPRNLPHDTNDYPHSNVHLLLLLLLHIAISQHHGGTRGHDTAIYETTLLSLTF